jgi:DNA-binding CsgD family transcriptional regulator
MALTRLKIRAIDLRKRGKSIGEIARQLKHNKSTVSTWCRNIVLSDRQRHEITRRQRERGNIGLLKAAEMKRSQRMIETSKQRELGQQDVGNLSSRDIYMIGLGLYWGEGYKNGNGEFGFTNSNPAIIRAFLRWIENAYAIGRPELILRVSINARYRTKNDAAIRYWSRITGVPQSQFTKTSFIRATHRKTFGNSDHYFGTLRIKVRCGTSLLRRVLGSLEHVATAV